MKFKKDFLFNYLTEAPVALAMERSMECEILSREDFKRPILDLGCGEGLFSYILFDEKIDAGIDPNAYEIERASAYGIYNELIECGGDKIPKEPNSFNTIFSNSVLEHIKGLDAVLKEAHRILACGGKFYVTIPTDVFDHYSIAYQTLTFLRLKGLAEKYRLFFDKFWKHYNYYNEEGWRERFEKAGFKVLKVKKYNNKRTCLLDDMLVPFSMPSFVVKKIFNRWFLFKSLRRMYAPLLYLMYKRLLSVDCEDGMNCGLLFFCLTKD